LQLCISSWKASGFRPISLNSPAEIEGFQMLPVEFQPVARSRPLIIDFLDAAKKSGSRIAGIVNADCMTIPMLNLGATLENLLDSGVVIVERIDISQHDLRPTGKPCLGFDAFFFTIESIEKICWSDDWKIGSPAWDFCFPLAFHAASQKILTLPSSGLVHLDHEKHWSPDEWLSAMPKLIRAVEENVALHQHFKPYLTLNPKRNEEFLPFANAVFDWLRNRDVLYSPAYESVEEFMTFMLAAMAVKPQTQPLSVKQLARQIPSATVRAAKRIIGKPLARSVTATDQ
jgi:hypothetical protein